HERVSLRTTTDAGQITAILTATLGADPVRHTVFGSVLGALESGWCAWRGQSVAARSTETFPVALTRWDEISDLVGALSALPRLEGLSGPVETLESVATALDRPARWMRNRLFRCEELLPTADVAGRPRLATSADAEQLVRWYAEFAAEADGLRADSATVVRRALRDEGCIWVWQDAAGESVSMARTQPAAGGVARIGPVYTPPPQRGRGFGGAVTAAATRGCLSAGVTPVLFTDLANPVSNHIYTRLGYRPVADYLRVVYG
ncbi:MAG: GNAT family N-acetyltransferase, partial [Pseudonocardia sp.]|nr:GNAT family N-acetyltransferase [Pseudonocardia sp.]